MRNIPQSKFCSDYHLFKCCPYLMHIKQVTNTKEYTAFSEICVFLVDFIKRPFYEYFTNFRRKSSENKSFLKSYLIAILPRRRAIYFHLAGSNEKSLSYTLF